MLDRDGAPVTAVRSSYLQLPTGGLYRYEDLMAGEALLIEAGLVQLEDECLYPSQCLSQILTLGEQDASELLLSVRLAACSPLWLQLAVQENMLAPEVIPSAQAEVLAGIIHEARSSSFRTAPRKSSRVTATPTTAERSTSMT